MHALMQHALGSEKLTDPASQVVPFSPAAGLLEWVEDTLPLSDYLTGRTRLEGAHARYRRPGDISFVDAYHVVAPPPAGQPARTRAEQRDIFDGVRSATMHAVFDWSGQQHEEGRRACPHTDA